MSIENLEKELKRLDLEIKYTFGFFVSSLALLGIIIFWLAIRS